MSEHDPTSPSAPAPESGPRDAVDAEAAAPAPPPTPPDAGWRSGRRQRRGPSLATGIWLGAAVLLLAAAAALSTQWWLAPPVEVAALPAPPAAAPLVDALATALDASVDESARAMQVLAGRLAVQLAAPPVVVLGAGQDEQAGRNADSLARLRERARAAVAEASPPLQVAIVDDKGGVVWTAGELSADAPALTSAVSALVQRQPLPPARVAALSAPRHDGLRVAVLFTAPLLVDEPLRQAAALAQQLDAASRAQAQALAAARADALRARDQWRTLSAVAVATPLLALVLLWLASGRRLGAELARLVERTARRAAGQEVEPAPALPVELAVVDELVARACQTAAQDLVASTRQQGLQASLGALGELCRRAAAGDLAARAEPATDASAALAVELNHLIESFEQRALRLRSHARGTRDMQAAAPDRAASVEQLRARAGALGPLPQLLADIAGRLRGFAEQLARGDDVKAELLKLADAVAARARTARAYLAGLGEAVASVEGVARQAPRVQQIADELDALTLDDSFAGTVGALRDLGPEEIQRRLAEARGDNEGSRGE